MSLVQRWDEARLLWEAKGYSIDEVGAVVQAQVAEGKRPELANLELSESTVARRTRSNRAVPKGLNELVEELSTKPGREWETEVVEAGLRVLRGQTPRSKDEPKKIAQALLAIFPTNDLALKLADALAKQANGKLDTMQATLSHADAQLEVMDTKIDRNGRTMLRGLWAAVAVCGIGALASMASCVASISQRFPPAPPVTSAPAPAPVHQVTVNIGPAMVEETARQRSTMVAKDPLGALATGEMGEKAPAEQWIPPQPFANQKVPPCDAGLYEVQLNGGCWTGILDARPPCGRLFRSGDKCYRPIAADPQKPIGFTPEAPAKEPR